MTAAVFANTASVLKDYGFGNFGLSEPAWSGGLIALGGLVAASVTLASRGSVWYALTLAWAFVGIAAANAGANRGVALAALCAVAPVCLALFLAKARGQKFRDACARRLVRASDRGTRRRLVSGKVHAETRGALTTGARLLVARRAPTR